METIDMQALAAIARRAGDEIMAVYATDFDVRGKAEYAEKHIVGARRR